MSHRDTCSEPGGKEESEKRVTAALQAFVAFWSARLSPWKPATVIKKYGRVARFGKGFLTRSNLPGTRTDPNCWDPVNREPLLQTKTTDYTV